MGSMKLTRALCLECSKRGRLAPRALGRCPELRSSAPQGAANPLHEHGHAERLGQVAEGAELERLGRLGLARGGGQHAPRSRRSAVACEALEACAGQPARQVPPAGPERRDKLVWPVLRARKDLAATPAPPAPTVLRVQQVQQVQRARQVRLEPASPVQRDRRGPREPTVLRGRPALPARLDRRAQPE